MPDAVDVSHHNNALDWAAAAHHGITLAYIHATHGNHHTDPHLDLHLTAARAAGLTTGLIHTPHLTTTATAEAHAFADALTARHAASPGNLPPCLDLHTHEPREIGRRNLTRWCVDFLDALRLATGRRQMLLRANPALLRTALNHGHDLDDDCLLWITHYGRDPGHPGHRDARTIAHHYTGRGRIDGSDGDINISYIWADLATLTAGAVPTEPGTGWHTVASGENLATIAERYRIPGGWKSLWDANRDIIDDPDVVFPDQRIRLPA